MIAIDTNLLVRYLTGDDEVQCKKVDHLIDRYPGEGAIFIADIVLVEIEWVLQSVYKFSRTAIADALHTVLSVQQFTFSDREMLQSALRKYKAGIPDFSDCLIGEEGRVRHVKTYTFDKQLKNDANFIVL